MGLGEAFSLLSAVTWAIAVILFRRAGEHVPAWHLNLLKTGLMAGLMVPTIAVFEPWRWPEIATADLIIAATSGVLGITLADTAYFGALNRIGASRSAVAGSLYTPYVLLLAGVFLGEHLSLMQGFGVVLVLVGVTLVSLPERTLDADRAQLRIGIALALLAPLLLAVSVVMVKPVLETESFLWVVAIRMAAALLSMTPLVAFRRSRQAVHQTLRNPKVPWRTVLAASFLGTYVALMLWLAGYKYADASIAAVLNETATVWIVIFAWVFLKERPSRRRIIGAVLAISGAAVVALR